MFKDIIAGYRKAYSGLTREMWLLSFIMLINRSGTMVVPFMTMYMTSPEMGFSLTQAGIVFGLFGLGSFLGAYGGGRLTDLLGFYSAQLSTLIGGGILFIILGLVNSYPLICLFAFLVSLVNEAFRPANSAAVAFYSKPEDFARSSSLNRLAINLGWAVGGALAGALANISYALLFWVDGVTNLIAACLMLNFLKPGLHKRKAKEGAKETSGSAYHDRTYLVFIVITTLFACCFFQFLTNVPVYFERELLLSKPTIGLLFALNGVLIVLFEMALIYRLGSYKDQNLLIVYGMALVALSYLLLNVTALGLVMPFLVVSLLTFGEILAMSFMNTYWIRRSSHSNRGQYAGLYAMGWAAAKCVGPVLGGFAAETYGFEMLWYLTALVGAIASCWLWVLTKPPALASRELQNEAATSSPDVASSTSGSVSEQGSLGKRVVGGSAQTTMPMNEMHDWKSPAQIAGDDSGSPATFVKRSTK